MLVNKFSGLHILTILNEMKYIKIPMWIIIMLFSTGFSHFAYIKSDERGFRHIIFEGYKFGYRSENATGSTYWRCTSQIKKTKIRCNASVSTKVLNGYEMLKKENHIHTCEKK